MRDQRSADIISLHAVLYGKILQSHTLASIDGRFKGREVDLGAIGVRHSSGHVVPFLNSHSIEDIEGYVKSFVHAFVETAAHFRIPGKAFEDLTVLAQRHDKCL